MLNNISELRLLFATCVLISHSIQLAQFTQYDILRKVFSSELAVQAFFILSGFLILGSYERSKTIVEFYKRRLLRVFPGYITAVLVFLGICLLYAKYINVPVSMAEISKYLAANLSLLNFLHPTIEGLFENNLQPEINGALWTIKVEVAFYLIVPIIYFLGKKWSFQIVSLLLMLCGIFWRPFILFMQANVMHLHPSLMHQLPGQLHYFAMGILLYKLTKNPKSWKSILIVLVMGLSTAFITDQHTIGIQMFSIFSFIFVLSKVKQIPNPIHKIDLSYGIYLTHFPTIQLLVALGFLQNSPILFVLVILISATLFALMSWTWVEQPALQIVKKRGFN